MVVDMGWIGYGLTGKGLKWGLSWMTQCGGHRTSVQHGTESPVSADPPLPRDQGNDVSSQERCSRALSSSESPGKVRVFWSFQCKWQKRPFALEPIPTEVSVWWLGGRGRQPWVWRVKTWFDLGLRLLRSYLCGYWASNEISENSLGKATATPASRRRPRRQLTRGEAKASGRWFSVPLL